MLAYRVLRAADRLWQAYAVTFTRKVKRSTDNGKRGRKPQGPQYPLSPCRPVKGAPSALMRSECVLVRGLCHTRAPRPGPIPPITANRSAGPHSGDAHPFRRSGKLSAVATDAPVASTLHAPDGGANRFFVPAGPEP